MKLNLRLSPSKGQRAFKSPDVTILVGEIEGFFSRGSGDGGKNQMNRAARRNANRAAQAHHRIEDGSYSARQWAAVHYRHRIAKIARTANEAGAIRFILQITDAFAVHNHHMRGPHGIFLVRAFAASGQQRAYVRLEFGFDE